MSLLLSSFSELLAYSRRLIKWTSSRKGVGERKARNKDEDEMDKRHETVFLFTINTVKKGKKTKRRGWNMDSSVTFLLSSSSSYFQENFFLLSLLFLKEKVSLSSKSTSLSFSNPIMLNEMQVLKENQVFISCASNWYTGTFAAASILRKRRKNFHVGKKGITMYKVEESDSLNFLELNHSPWKWGWKFLLFFTIELKCIPFLGSRTFRTFRTLEPKIAPWNYFFHFRSHYFQPHHYPLPDIHLMFRENYNSTSCYSTENFFRERAQHLNRKNYPKTFSSFFALRFYFRSLSWRMISICSPCQGGVNVREKAIYFHYFWFHLLPLSEKFHSSNFSTVHSSSNFYLIQRNGILWNVKNKRGKRTG